MKTMYVASVLALLSIFGASDAIQINRFNENRLEELERKLATEDNAGTRDMMQWLQPGRLGVKRAEESSYIRFGKRGFVPVAVKQENAAQASDLSGYRPRRTSQSSYIRFGKRGGHMTYDNECIGDAMRRARSLSQFHDLLMVGGCFKIQKREPAKKDGFVRFGKRSQLINLQPDSGNVEVGGGDDDEEVDDQN